MRTCLLACAALLAPLAAGMDTARRIELRDEVRDMFHHGYSGYLTYAYPADELRPITCAPLWRDTDASNVGVNDIHANASVTLVDALSAIALILPEAFPDALERVVRDVDFDQDVKVQVFEMTIRALGALLSTYQKLDALPSDPHAQAESLGIKGPVDVKRHMKRILFLAHDLGKRLLPAFKTSTGLPYARVNLRHGVELRESQETCSAGAGSLVLEFALLSRLTGDGQFEDLAKKAFMAIWNRRSEDDLLGNTIGVVHGSWMGSTLSGVNAGIDSFFEYALKAAIMLDDSMYMDVFNDAYSAIQTHVRTNDGFFYRPVHLKGLKPAHHSHIDSLSAFFPGVQALAGDLDSAIRGHLIFWNLWRRYSAIPESWEHNLRKVTWSGWPGRPEFIESTYYLHRATDDGFYLRVGERVVHDIKRRTMTACGFATLSNVETGKTADRMESFLLSETLKYLYLLFDPSPSVMSNTVFTTEGHPLHMPPSLSKAPSAKWRAAHRREDLFCPSYLPQTVGGLRVGIEARDDYDYARTLVFGPGEAGVRIETATEHWGEGVCKVPSVPRWSFDLVLGPADSDPDAPLPAHDPSPGPHKVHQGDDGDWVITDIDGLRLACRWRLDGLGYDVSSIGPHRVRQGQRVIIRDSRMEGYLPMLAPTHAPSEVNLSLRNTNGDEFGPIKGATATFGRSLEAWDEHALLAVSEGNLDLCKPVRLASLSPAPAGGFALLAMRGTCTFAVKALHAASAGAVLLVVADNAPSEAGELIRPGLLDESEQVERDTEALGVVHIHHAHGQSLVALLHKDAQFSVLVDAVESSVAQPARREGRLVVGEHDLVNLRVVEEL